MAAHTEHMFQRDIREKNYVEGPYEEPPEIRDLEQKFIDLRVGDAALAEEARDPEVAKTHKIFRGQILDLNVRLKEILKILPQDIKDRLENEDQVVRTIEWMQEKVAELEKDMDVLVKRAHDPTIRPTYQIVRERMLKLRDRLEDVLKTLPEDSWAMRKETTRNTVQGLNSSFNRMVQKDLEHQEEEASAEYREMVGILMRKVIRIQNGRRLLLDLGYLPDYWEEMNERLHEIYRQLQRVDQEYIRRGVHPADSSERKALVKLIQDMWNITPEPKKKPTEANAARAIYQKVRAVYASVSHTLSLDQRREYRRRIAQLSAMIRSAEEEPEVVVTLARTNSDEYFQSPAFVRAAASLAMARADASAASLASAVLE